MHILWTGQTGCYDSRGREIPCPGSGQDGEIRPGRPWPDPRFRFIGGDIVEDRATGLLWSADANLFSFPMSWQDGLDVARQMRRERAFGRDDWRLPNRRELRSLVSHQAKKPALPHDHPFRNVFLGWYWTSTTSAVAPGYAWYVHLEGGRMFYGKKDSQYLVWPVSGDSGVLPATGQATCFDMRGNEVFCDHSGQDGELQLGVDWPSERFVRREHGIEDRLTGLLWYDRGDLPGRPAAWEQVLAAVKTLASKTEIPWRLPTINELESLVDASAHAPALPRQHPFAAVQPAYWSATTSYFEPDWAYVLYFDKGAVGVGFKMNEEFYLWPVVGRQRGPGL
ncbi:hypothetical protein HNQ81_002420 [Desulfoprunum benzoelyticum]|uniref:Lcl C-terminal domain-containing protein n=1 Tax=Desulfoprunum benzoelyticum TaxID=1506996 RepID=A0A840V477_9BACT|nr:DUF1566 domain-containing protein [Desulfoprunum benzoelyticum]MBB5348680.1 hypothetical protein [Desulfoprunum benzoelyticum]